MKIEERTYTELLLSPDEWDTVQHGLQLLVEQHRNPIAARMLGTELDEYTPEATSTPTTTPKRRGRPKKLAEATPEMIAEAERIQAINNAAPAAMHGVVMEEG